MITMFIGRRFPLLRYRDNRNHQHTQGDGESGIVFDAVDSFGDAPSNVVTVGLIECARDAVKGGFND